MNKVFDAYAEYYDLLYKDKNYKQEVDYVVDLLQDNDVKCGSILELGSGTGKHAEEFVKTGFNVLGVDLSSVMVGEANKRINDSFIGRLQFNVGDACSYRANKKFDAVISLFHVMSYQTKNENVKAVFQTAAEHLNPGGIFVFDYWYGPGVLTTPPEVRVKRLEGNNALILRIAEPKMHLNDNIVEVNYNLHVKQKTLISEVSELKEQHKMRYFFIPELMQFCHENFILKDSFSWMKKTPPDFSDWNAVSVFIKK